MTDAAVVVPVHPSDTRIAFVARSSDSTTRANDVGFPGGKREPTDESLRATARRETIEETALAPGEFDPVGEVAPHATRSTGFELHPFLARVDASDRFQPDSQQVTETFRVPAARLRDAYETDRIRYRPGDRDVWGVTARIATTTLVTGCLDVSR